MRGLVIVETFCIYLTPHTKEIIKKGSGNQNIQCQLKFSVNSPAKVGPTAGADKITKATTPIAVPLFSGGKIIKIVLNIKGSSKPVPMAWKTRAINKKTKLDVRAAIRKPIIEKLSDVMNNCLVVNHLIRNPEIGTNVPNISK
ncbi:hypothetical protein ALO_20092 [Acetonema longum DSM 6540]|uniref:Uncharacterized protein n=1 Tax=Acetonema longum DSM 6540 TaxID=1009370 RepID=F7NPH3_9FIRM|nr:hypothetical protein ALO_20092 [Acetonema longum DSM 6540]